MGFLSPFYSRSAGVSPTTQIASPWSDTQLQSIVWSDIFGTQPTVITRAEAMSVPGVFRARSILHSLIADKPLRAYKGPGLVEVQPTWTQRTDGVLSPIHRMAQTLDDLIFEGWSLWAVERGAAGQITSAAHVPFERWSFDGFGRILVQQTPNGAHAPIDAERVILIPGPSAGLLAYANRSLRGAIAMESAWVERVKNPIPQIDLHLSEDNNATPEELKAMAQSWDYARNSGATAVTPSTVEARPLGTVSPDLFTEGRNNARLDIANFFALPASLIEGSVSTASLTYSTQEGKRNEVLDFTIPYWIGQIEGRLSQDDVVPAGQRVRFDFATLIDLPQSPTGAETDD